MKGLSRKAVCREGRRSKKQALLDASSDQKQQKLYFSPLTLCKSSNNNDLLHGANASSSTESIPGEAKDNETVHYLVN